MSEKLEAVVTADVTQFKSKMKDIGFTADNASKLITAAFAAVTAAIGFMTKKTLESATSFETLKLRLQLLSGDMKKGAAEFDLIRQKAKESSFNTDELIDSYIRLRATAGQEFATKQLDNIGYAAKVAGEDMSTMASRVGELAIRIESGLSGGLLKKSLRTFATAFGREGTLGLINMVDAGAEADEILKQLGVTLDRFGAKSKKAWEASTAGKLDRLGGIMTDTFAVLAEEGGAAENFNKILSELIDMSDDYSNETASLSLALGDLLATILKLVESEGFKDFVGDAIDGLTLLTKAAENTFQALFAILKVYEKYSDFWDRVLKIDEKKQFHTAAETQQLVQESRAKRDENKKRPKVEVVTPDGEPVFK